MCVYFVIKIGKFTVFLGLKVLCIEIYLKIQYTNFKSKTSLNFDYENLFRETIWFDFLNKVQCSSMEI